jgi:hypothetical protein
MSSAVIFNAWRQVMKLTVFYDGQFWIGVVERSRETQLSAAHYVFGSEPQSEEILEFINRNLLQLIQAQTQAVEIKPPVERKLNPKRLARQVMKEASAPPVSTKAQEALQMQMEANKKEKQVQSKQQRLEQQERKRLISRQKAKQRHRGK